MSNFFQRFYHVVLLDLTQAKIRPDAFSLLVIQWRSLNFLLILQQLGQLHRAHQLASLMIFKTFEALKTKLTRVRRKTLVFVW
jgi:hypothetical protein